MVLERAHVCRKPEVSPGPAVHDSKPLELKCRVQFEFERNFKPFIKWQKVYPDSKEEDIVQTHLRSPEKNVLGTIYLLTSTLDEVTSKELNALFLCHAQNSIGTSTTVIKLVRKPKVVAVLVFILCSSVLLLLFLVTGSVIVYLYWIEIVLLYRNYFSKDETVGDNKEYDAFVSYAKHSFVEGEETSEDSYDEERFAVECLPSVLEDKYDYKLCLLERDTLPGRVYIEEIIQMIKRSRRVIFILSPRYFTGPSLFELHAAVTCLMEEEPLKLILIKFKPFREPDSLPHVVKKALNALPIITWKGKSSISSSMHTKFWNRIRYYMPIKKKKISLH
ncbi:interleukin-18 receptor accessory protein-like [Discoglossus pictus]